MRRRLVVGLGGEVSGDDAIGCRVTDHLVSEDRLPPDVEVIRGGSDLLRLGPWLLGRERVLLVDAIEGMADADPVLVRDHPDAELVNAQTHAHHLSPVQALELLRLTTPELERVRFTWVLIPIDRAAPAEPLSEALESRLPEIVERVLAELSG